MKNLLRLIPLLLLAPSLAWGQVVIPGTGGPTPAVVAGNRTTVIPALCTGTDKMTGIATGGIVQCNTDISAAPGSGITTLNTLTDVTQTFSKVDDTNVTLAIASAAGDHEFTLGWTGTLADSRIAQITTASKVSGAALTLLTSVPAGAGDLPVANLPDVEALTTSLTAARCVRVNAGGTALEVAAADCGTGAVDSVFTRTGAVVATEGDYSLSLLSDVASTTGSGTVSVLGTNPTLTDVTVNDLITFTETAGDATCGAGDFNLKGNSSTNKMRGCENGTLFDLNTAGGGNSFGTIGTAVADSGADTLTVTDSGTIDFTTTDNPEDLTAIVIANSINATQLDETVAYAFSSTTNTFIGASYTDGSGAAPSAGVLRCANNVTCVAAEAAPAAADGTILYNASEEWVFNSPISVSSGGTDQVQLGSGTNLSTWQHTFIEFEGTTDNAFETRFAITDPTVDRTVTVPNADSTTVQPDTGAANNFLTAISAAGVISKAQPDFSNLSGTASAAQIQEVIALADLTDVASTTGSGTVSVLGTAPTFVTSITTPVVISGAGDPADAGFLRVGNAEDWLCAESAPTGTEICVQLDASENWQFDNDLAWLSGTAFQGVLAHANTALRTYSFGDRNMTVAAVVGTPATGNCAEFDANDDLVDAGAACGGSDGVGYDEILDEATGRTKRAQLNFIGGGVSCVDNPGATRTDCTIAGGGATTLDTVTAAAGGVTIANADFAIVWNWFLTTASKSALTFGETTAATATGTPILLNIQTLAASTANPLQVTARGTANGIRVGATDGVLDAIGTGGVDFGALLNYPTACSNQFIRAILDTPTCNTVGTSDIAAGAADNTIIRDSAGFSVIGKSTTGSGDPADIVAGDETVFGRTAAGNLVFAALVTGQIANDAITFPKMQNIATDRLIGRDTAASGDPEELTVGGGLNFTGSGGIQCDAASTTAVGCPEMAIASEVDTGTSIILAVTPDALAGSTFGQVEVQMVLFDFTTAVTTGDGAFYFHIATGSKLIGMDLVDAIAAVITVSSSGLPEVDIARCAPVATGNVCSGTVADALTVNLTIDVNEDSSDTASTGITIATASDGVVVDQTWRLDVDTAGTGTQGLIVTLIFQLP